MGYKRVFANGFRSSRNGNVKGIFLAVDTKHFHITKQPFFIASENEWERFVNWQKHVEALQKQEKHAREIDALA